MNRHLLELCTFVFAGAALLAVAQPSAAAKRSDQSGSAPVAPGELLAEGTTALMQGEWQRGVDLTELGLQEPATRGDRVIGHANLCGGYVSLKQFERALESCDRALDMFEGNWRAWQNRAAANLGLGRIDAAMRDIRRGLAINPDSADLRKLRSIAQERQAAERMNGLLAL